MKKHAGKGRNSSGGDARSNQPKQARNAGKRQGSKPMHPPPTKLTNSSPAKKIIVHTDKTSDIRINKYISESGFCSRREADRLVEQGKVTIDGVKAGMGDKVLPGQKVKVSGHLITNQDEMVYIAFNKPTGVTSTTDTKDRSNIIDYISHEQRIFPIGRLDKDSQGLILLTNDGDIVNKILRAGNNHEKEYIVTVNRPITEEFIRRMGNGVPILGINTRKCFIEKIADRTFRIILKQGLNRQIRRMCEHFDYEVTKLQRIRIMNIELGNLKIGQWRNLDEKELTVLNEQIQKSTKKAKEPNPEKKLGEK